MNKEEYLRKRMSQSRDSVSPLIQRMQDEAYREQIKREEEERERQYRESIIQQYLNCGLKMDEAQVIVEHGFDGLYHLLTTKGTDISIDTFRKLTWMFARSWGPRA